MLFLSYKIHLLPDMYLDLNDCFALSASETPVEYQIHCVDYDQDQHMDEVQLQSKLHLNVK